MNNHIEKGIQNEQPVNTPVNPNREGNKTSLISKLQKINSKHIFSGLIIVIFIIFLSGYKIMSDKKQNHVENNLIPTPTIKETSSSSEIEPIIPQNSEVPIPSSTPLPSPTPQLFTLNLSTRNYSSGQPTGDVVGAKIKLYDKAGTLLGEKVIPPQEPGSNKFPVVTYYVPLGTYKFEAETDNLFNTGEITISSYDDQAYQTLNLIAKPMTISGIFFVDSNKNNQYDSGEERLANQEIKAYHMGEASFEIWEAGSSVTDTNGNFSIPIKNYSGLYQLQGPLYLPYYPAPLPRVTLNGGENVNLNVIMWPK